MEQLWCIKIKLNATDFASPLFPFDTPKNPSKTVSVSVGSSTALLAFKSRRPPNSTTQIWFFWTVFSHGFFQPAPDFCCRCRVCFHEARHQSFAHGQNVVDFNRWHIWIFGRYVVRIRTYAKVLGHVYRKRRNFSYKKHVPCPNCCDPKIIYNPRLR